MTLRGEDPDSALPIFSETTLIALTAEETNELVEAMTTWRWKGRTGTIKEIGRRLKAETGEPRELAQTTNWDGYPPGILASTKIHVVTVV
ncbi:unnamed protein product [Cyprideis torosa]|uniref:Uncharacterized protein n=1 Tax=Cyprideis torosa TaxID=163714 RepID=A0A7R8W5H4_9CRUS|nr:unnamed protein product [Cyprideis torosa]CAG0885199.1 unnamed protein product [Cyprideis torosa]